MEKNFILKVNFKGSDEERFYIFDDEEFAKDVAKMIYSMNKDSHGKVICSLIPSVKYTDYDEVPELANHCPDYKERSMAYIERIAKSTLIDEDENPKHEEVLNDGNEDTVEGDGTTDTPDAPETEEEVEEPDTEEQVEEPEAKSNKPVLKKAKRVGKKG